VLDQRLDVFEAQFDHRFFGGSNYLIAGTGYRNLDLPNPILIEDGVTTSRFEGDPSFLRNRRWSVFVQDQQSLANDLLQLTLGVRYDDSNIYRGFSTLRGAVHWQVTDDTALKLLYGESFREPTIFELENNPALEPGEMDSIELSVQSHLGEAVSVQAAVFVNDATNLIEVDRTHESHEGRTRRMRTSGLGWGPESG
jgi:outer membrane cobalamin receptor